MHTKDANLYDFESKSCKSMIGTARDHSALIVKFSYIPSCKRARLELRSGHL